MVGWHHQLNGQESAQTPGDSEGQGSKCCRDGCAAAHGVAESNITEKLNNNNNKAGFMPSGIWSSGTLNASFTKNELSIEFSLLTWNSNSQKQQEPHVEKIPGK